MENTETTTNKIQIQAKVDPEIVTALENFRIAEDRSMSNMIERLLKTHPRIQPILEAQTAEVGV